MIPQQVQKDKQVVCVVLFETCIAVYPSKITHLWLTKTNNFALKSSRISKRTLALPPKYYKSSNKPPGVYFSNPFENVKIFELLYFKERKQMVKSREVQIVVIVISTSQWSAFSTQFLLDLTAAITDSCEGRGLIRGGPLIGGNTVYKKQPKEATWCTVTLLMWSLRAVLSS